MILRLSDKKDYAVKDVGQEKKFVTTFNKNIK